MSPTVSGRRQINVGTKTDKVTKVQHDGVGERTNDKPNSGGGLGVGALKNGSRSTMRREW